MNLLKKHLANILIIAGIAIMIITITYAYIWKITQNNLLDEFKVNMDDEVISHEKTEYLDYKKELPTEEIIDTEIQEDDEIEDPGISREDYKSGMMIIDIEKINVRAGIVEGTTRSLLKEGPGLYEISPLPDKEGGNVCIAGHRTTYGAWFRHVDKLEKDDEIILEYNNLKYIYKVEKVFIVDKKDWSVTEPVGHSALTLTACHPLRSDRQRIVVRAKLKKDFYNNNNALGAWHLSY